jgi:hypothetical protein
MTIITNNQITLVIITSLFINCKQLLKNDGSVFEQRYHVCFLLF